jgi:YbbR domain-containing protein
MNRKIATISLIVAFSVLLWIFVSFDGEFSISLNLPTQVINVPEDHSISFISSDDISISLKGQGWQLAQHTLGRDPKYYIPSPTEVGEREITLRNALVVNSWLSSTLQLAEITPEKIIVAMEPTKSKKVEIIPVLSMGYKAGYGLVSPIKIDPDSVMVTGPESIIDQINIINTEGKILSNLENESSIVLQVVTPKYTFASTNECSVNFDVQKIVDKTFDDLVIDTKNIPSRYELIVAPTRLSIILRGGISILSRLKNEDLNVYVKFEQAINDTSGAIEPIIEIPEFTSLVDIKPSRLEYIIKKY